MDFIRWIKHKKIVKVVNEKNLKKLNEDLKGVEGVAKTLEVDAQKGIPDDEKMISRRRIIYGSNTYEKPSPEGFFSSIWRTLRQFAVLDDFTNILAAVTLFIAAYVAGSYIVSPVRKSKTTTEDEDSNQVLRDGRSKRISASEIVVGDVVCLKMGDKVPADGLLVFKGKELMVESMTWKKTVEKRVDEKRPFLFSGYKVVGGYGEMIVTSVGMKAKRFEMMRKGSLDASDKEITTRVEDRVYELASSVRNRVGVPTALLGVVALIIKYFILTTGARHRPGIWEYNDSLLQNFIGTTFTAVVVVIPESLRLGAALAINFSKRRMLAGMEMVSDVSGFETFGSVTAICSTKGGILSTTEYAVQQFWVGGYFEDDAASFSYDGDSSSGQQHCVTEMFRDGIVGLSKIRRKSEVEKAILSWASQSLGVDTNEDNIRCEVVKDQDVKKAQDGVFRKELRGVVMMREHGMDQKQVHWNGEARRILYRCSKYYSCIHGCSIDLDDCQKKWFLQKIEDMKKNQLYCVGFACNQVWDRHHFDNDLILLGLVGVRYPCHPQAKQAVLDCQEAGVDVKMITGDDEDTARYIAKECGIYDPQDLDKYNVDAVMKGDEFRRCSQEERLQKVDRLRVLAEAKREDKGLVVRALKEKGGVVAFSGSTIYDLAALIEADVGISMNFDGTETAKKVSDIVVLDSNFATLAYVLESSICVYNNMQKFIQFQLTLSLASLAIIFISAVYQGELLLNSTQVLWLHMMVTTMASLALSTEKPRTQNKKPIKRQPVGRLQPLVSNIMWRNILAQVVYQIAVFFALLFLANSILGFEPKSYFIKQRKSLVFHAFLLCQVVNEFNARDIEQKNVFKGIVDKDALFLFFVAVTVCVQLVFAEFFLYKSDYFARLGVRQWLICFGFAFISLLVGWIAKCLPVPQKPFLSYPELVWSRLKNLFDLTIDKLI